MRAWKKENNKSNSKNNKEQNRIKTKRKIIMFAKIIPYRFDKCEAYLSN